MVEDVRVKVEGFTFLDDFVVMEMEKDEEVHLIMDRPFMKIVKVIDVDNGKLR